jgi:hypothetical protein
MTAIQAPIVTVGCRRSGTTLLRSMMSGHPDLLVHPGEPRYILGLWRKFGSTIRNVPAALAYVAAQPNLPDGLSEDGLESACGSSRQMSLRQLVHCCLQAWGKDELCRKRIVLKHPALVFHLDLLPELFPDVHVVHVVRDPRAAVSSQLSRWPKLSVWEAAEWWRNSVRAGRTWQRRGTTPYTEVQYEDLVLSPGEALGRLCRHLGISYHPGMLKLELETKLYSPDAPPSLVQFSSPDPSRIMLWRERLSPLEIRMVEACCHKEMAWWGYEPVAPRVSAVLFASRLLGEKLRYELKAAIRRIRTTVRQTGWRPGIARLTSEVVVTGGVSLEGEEHG